MRSWLVADWQADTSKFFVPLNRNVLSRLLQSICDRSVARVSAIRIVDTVDTAGVCHPMSNVLNL